jgi:hypothetical protein
MQRDRGGCRGGQAITSRQPERQDGGRINARERNHHAASFGSAIPHSEGGAVSPRAFSAASITR